MIRSWAQVFVKMSIKLNTHMSLLLLAPLSIAVLYDQELVCNGPGLSFDLYIEIPSSLDMINSLTLNLCTESEATISDFTVFPKNLNEDFMQQGIYKMISLPESCASNSGSAQGVWGQPTWTNTDTLTIELSNQYGLSYVVEIDLSCSFVTVYSVGSSVQLDSEPYFEPPDPDDPIPESGHPFTMFFAHILISENKMSKFCQFFNFFNLFMVTYKLTTAKWMNNQSFTKMTLLRSRLETLFLSLSKLITQLHRIKSKKEV